MLQTLKALADPTRLRLLGILAHGEFTVQELTAILAMGQSRISRHLRILTEAGIASVKRQGTWGTIDWIRAITCLTSYGAIWK